MIIKYAKYAQLSNMIITKIMIAVKCEDTKMYVTWKNMENIQKYRKHLKYNSDTLLQIFTHSWKIYRGTRKYIK